jgi:RNA-directed DNA polymerase
MVESPPECLARAAQLLPSLASMHKLNTSHEPGTTMTDPPQPPVIEPVGLAILQRLASFRDVADVLRVSPQKLSYILFRADPKKRYRRFYINKRSGAKRLIMAPHPALRAVQARLNALLLDTYQTKPSVHSFVRGRGIHSNAARHLKKKHVLVVDLADFFPSINFGRVRGMFMGKPYLLAPDVATALAQVACFENQLPQGAPSSPIISNMICGQMDSHLQALARVHRCEYSRYADDLTFSTTASGFPTNLALVTFDGTRSKAEPGVDLRRVIERNGFAINEAKVRLARAAWHQEVTGLTVNTRLNVRRTYVRQVRAMLHALRKFGETSASKEHSDKFRSANRRTRAVSLSKVIRGKVEFLRLTRGHRDYLVSKLVGQFRAIAPDYAQGLTAGGPGEMDGQVRDVFLCHTGKDKATVVRPLCRALAQRKISAWLDEAEISWGDGVAESINAGLANSRFVVVCLSRGFPDKNWPKKELFAAMAGEIEAGKVRVLPLMIGDDGAIQEILHRLPLLKDKHYERWTGDPTPLCDKLEALLRHPK